MQKKCSKRSKQYFEDLNLFKKYKLMTCMKNLGTITQNYSCPSSTDVPSSRLEKAKNNHLFIHMSVTVERVGT